MNDLQIFNSSEFGAVRTVEENGKVLFCGSDVAKALGYTNPNKAINDHCRAITKRDTPISGKMQSINFIPEGDIYRLIVNSKLPSADKFERWVFEEVLPSIRKHGMYATDELLANPDIAIAAFTALKAEREKSKSLETKIEEDKPKVIFADAVSSSKSSILVGELAKLLKQNNVNIGQNRLFAHLRDNGYLIKRNGSDWNMPTQRSMDMKLFTVKETAVVHSDGHTSINKTVKVTGKGQQYFINLFLGEDDNHETI